MGDGNVWGLSCQSCRVSSWAYCHLDLPSFWDCLGFLFGLVRLVLFSQYFLIPGTGLESPMTGDGNDIIMHYHASSPEDVCRISEANSLTGGEPRR